MPENLPFHRGWTEEEIVEYMRAYLKKRGFRVIDPPKPRRELVNQVRLTDYDPETGELMQERYVDLRDADGRPT